MRRTKLNIGGWSLTIVAAAALFAACSDDGRFASEPPVTNSPPAEPPSPPAPDTSKPSKHDRDVERAITTLQRVTARYHNLDLAKKDGFVLLHECEVLPGEGPIGTVYINPARLTDGGHIDPKSPEALIYEPQKHGPPKLVGVEFAISFGDWNGAQPPEFLGNAFQAEDEVSAFGLHVWVWRDNPNGMFAETNPNVSCGA